MTIETREEIVFVKQSKHYDDDGNIQLITQVHRQEFHINPDVTVVNPVDQKKDKDGKVTRQRVKGVTDKIKKVNHRNQFFKKGDFLPQDVKDWLNNA